jgi:hypothetical protein
MDSAWDSSPLPHLSVVNLGLFLNCPSTWTTKGLDAGGFETAIGVIDSRDGQFYAAKSSHHSRGHQMTNKKRKLEQEDWLKGIRNEYTIIKNNPHVSPTPILFRDLGLIV